MITLDELLAGIKTVVEMIVAKIAEWIKGKFSEAEEETTAVA